MTLSLRLGRNLTSLSFASDPTDRGTRIMPLAVPLATSGAATFLGVARWRVVSVNSGAKTLVLEDAGGGAGPIGFDSQFVGWYVWREASNAYALIDASVTSTQTLTLHAWLAGLAAGDYLEFRLTAPGTSTTLYSYRTSSPATLPPTPGLPVTDAEITTLVGSVITLRDAFLFGGINPVARDGQHVGRQVRLSELVATDVITDFSSVGGVYTYSFADVSAYHVGDWMRRAADNGGAFVYGDINTKLTTAFSVSMTITAVDSGANTVTVESRDGLGRVIFDTAVFGAGYTDIRIYRPTSTLRTVTASSGSAHTLTLDSVSGFSLSGGPGAAEILITTTSASGGVPYYLDHPLYSAPTFPGIGIKFRTIDRTQNPALVGAATLNKNAVMRQWATPTAMPDGWTAAPSVGIAGSGTPTPIASGGFVDIAQNTDPLFTRVGGQSLLFSITTGVLITAPIPWVPAYPGQQFSVRGSLLLTKWAYPAIITLQFGILKADGTILPWYDQPRSESFQPAGATTPRLNPPFVELAGNVWDDATLNAFDITEPSVYPFNPRPNASDIADLANAQGIVAILSMNANGGRIEGYLDGVMITASVEAPNDVSEFGDANRLHQDTNVALAQLAKPQVTISGSFYDLARVNPTDSALQATDRPIVGQLALVNDAVLGIVNETERISDVKTNVLVPGDTQLTLASRTRRFSDFLSPGPSGSTATPGSGPTGGGGSAPLALAISVIVDENLQPVVTATLVSSDVTRVKFAVDIVRTPTDAAVRAAGSVTAVAGAFSATFPAIVPGTTVYAAAFAYDAGSEESEKAVAQVTESLMPPNYLFLQRGVGYRHGDWGGGSDPEGSTTAAADNTHVSAWLDQSGNGFHFLSAINQNFLTYDDRFVPIRNASRLRFGLGTFDGRAYMSRLSSAWWAAMGSPAEILVGVQCVDGAPVADGLNNLWDFARSLVGRQYFPKSDGHIYETWPSALTDLGAVPGGVDLSLMNAYGIQVAPATVSPNYIARINGAVIHQTTHITDPDFQANNPTIGLGQGGGYFNGWFGDIVIPTVVWTLAQRKLWTDYVKGITSTPPVAGGFGTPTLSFTRSGGDVIVTATEPLADYVRIAASVSGTPSDATTRLAVPTMTRPFQATFPAPTAGQTLDVAAFAYLAEVESPAKATLAIPFGTSDGTGGGGASGDAEFVIAAADDGLPNARVVTDSDSVTWDRSVDGILTAHAIDAGGVWSPLTNGDPTTPEIVFADGDVIMAFTPS